MKNSLKRVISQMHFQWTIKITQTKRRFKGNPSPILRIPNNKEPLKQKLLKIYKKN